MPKQIHQRIDLLPVVAVASSYLFVKRREKSERRIIFLSSFFCEKRGRFQKMAVCPIFNGRGGDPENETFTKD